VLFSSSAGGAGDPLRGFGEYEGRQAAAVDKKRMYQLELQKQVRLSVFFWFCLFIGTFIV